MIDWQTENVTGPPLTKNIGIDHIKEIIRTGSSHISLMSSLPSHTQAVERMIKLATHASARVCGKESRDVFIRTTLSSREDMKTFNTKKEFVKIIQH